MSFCFFLVLILDCGRDVLENRGEAEGEMGKEREEERGFEKGEGLVCKVGVRMGSLFLVYEQQVVPKAK